MDNAVQKRDLLKRELVQKGFQKMMEDADVPMQQHLKVVRALSDAHKNHEKDRKAFVATLQNHLNKNKKQEQLIEYIYRALQHVKSLKQGEKGDPGEAGITPDENRIIEGVLGQIPKPKDGESPRIKDIVQYVLAELPKPKDGKDGENIDTDKIIAEVLKEIRKGNVLDLTHIKGAQTFIKDRVTYRIEELMHGGGSAASSGVSIIAISGTIDNSNVTFTATSEPKLLNINGAFYQKNGGAITWTYTTGTIVLSSPVGSGGAIFGIA